MFLGVCMRTFGNSGIQNAVGQILNAGQSEIVFRSQVTPEIRINVANLLSSSPSQTAVQGSDATAMKFIKPEVIVKSLGVERSFAPYGKPTTNFYSTMVYGAAAMMLIGGATAWWLCRR